MKQNLKLYLILILNLTDQQNKNKVNKILDAVSTLVGHQVLFYLKNFLTIYFPNNYEMPRNWSREQPVSSERDIELKQNRLQSGLEPRDISVAL